MVHLYFLLAHPHQAMYFANNFEIPIQQVGEDQFKIDVWYNSDHRCGGGAFIC
jgi:hypothetical protein